MLAISRRKRQSVMIVTASGESVEVMVSQVRGDKVRLAFKADRSIAIDRQEVYESKQERRAREAALARQPRVDDDGGKAA